MRGWGRGCLQIRRLSVAARNSHHPWRGGWNKGRGSDEKIAFIELSKRLLQLFIIYHDITSHANNTGELLYQLNIFLA